MPEEYRKLVFTADELKHVAAEFCVGNGLILPQDDLVGIELTGNADHPLRLEYVTATRTGLSNLSLSRDQLGAALILYCRKRHIPVPRTAEKNVKIDGSEVSLLVHVPS